MEMEKTHAEYRERITKNNNIISTIISKRAATTTTATTAAAAELFAKWKRWDVMWWEELRNMMSANKWKASFCQSVEEVWVGLICDGSRGGRAKIIIFFGIIWVFECVCCSSESKRKKSFLRSFFPISNEDILLKQWILFWCRIFSINSRNTHKNNVVCAVRLAWAHALPSTYAPIPHLKNDWSRSVRYIQKNQVEVRKIFESSKEDRARARALTRTHNKVW